MFSVVGFFYVVCLVLLFWCCVCAAVCLMLCVLLSRVVCTVRLVLCVCV